MAQDDRFDQILDSVFQQHDERGQEIKFLSTVFHFLQRKTQFFEKESSARLIRALVQKHVDRVQKKPESEEKVEPKPAAAPAPMPPTPMDTTGDDDAKEPPPLGNGGKTDRYVWTQTLSEVTVIIEVPADVKAKDLNVNIQGELMKEIEATESTWILDPTSTGKAVTIYLRKVKKMEWWSGVIQGDPTIDTKKIVPESSKLSELDPSTRAMVEKMMFDQRMKQMGKPTSEDLQKQELLRKLQEKNPGIDFSNATLMS